MNQLNQQKFTPFDRQCWLFTFGGAADAFNEPFTFFFSAGMKCARIPAGADARKKNNSTKHNISETIDKRLGTAD
jgi:hypothetical protein